ncbi:MAG TPA: hypothetical protein VEF33_08670 [Syntrophales bacterium]|nr:hypothetical protein [Syntrophales bacterium]
MSQDNLVAGGYSVRSSEVLERCFSCHLHEENYPADNHEDHKAGNDIDDTKIPGVLHPTNKIYRKRTDTEN